MEENRKNSNTGLSERFSLLTEELLSLSYGRVNNKEQMQSYLNELNLLDYRYIQITNTNTVLLLIHQLCTNIQSCDTALVKCYSELIVNIIQGGGTITGRTFCTCEKWFFEALEYAKLDTRNIVLYGLQVLLQSGPFDLIAQNLRPLLGENGLLTKLFSAANENYWAESNYLAISCFEAILVNKENSAARIAPEFARIIKEIVLTILRSLTCDCTDKIFYNKVVCCCLRVLCKLMNEAAMTENQEDVGEVLGIVKAFLFHGINGYSPIKVQCLRPAAMNLPEVVHIRGSNTRNKIRPKRQTQKKSSVEEKNSGNSSPSEKLPAPCRYSSDSETESFTPAQTESTVRLEALHLLHAAMKSISSRDMFGYWPQIVASGSRDSARVLTRSVLKEPVAKVRRTVLSTLSKLLVNAKHFLLHADDSEHPSFLTFFGTVGAMICELYLALSLVLSYERNATVLIHALKCASGLAQGTPYARLKPGLATKLSRNCRVYMLHKDPTVRVSALSVFESLALTVPLTPEIIGILGKESKISNANDFPQLSYDATRGVDCDDQEEAVEFESVDLTNHCFEDESEIEDELSRNRGISSLLQVCLKYISNEEEKGPVRLHSLKCLGALASNVDSLVFGHLETVTATLATVAHQDADVQVAHHACRVIETLAGRIANCSPEDVNIIAFWNTVFVPVTSLIHHPQMTLREVTCDCLGNMGSVPFSQLSRDKSILIITILFGAVRDEESAVRAAAVRALGMLVTMPPLEEDTGFLMDLADIVCRAIDDQNLGVRVKACWALANLCDCLTRQRANDVSEPVPLDILLPRLYITTVKAAEDNCKVKCNAMRAVGSVIRLCSDKQVIADASDGLQVLIKCAISEKDMKVRWNACRALGFVMSYKPDQILPSSWRDQVFPVLCDLIGHSPNFKVRTNAAWALSACGSYGKYGPFLWKSIVIALENSRHVPSFIEYPHRDALIQQLCLTLSHLAARTDLSDLQSVWFEVRDHLDDISRHMKHLHNNVLPEKADDLVAAKTQLQRLSQVATHSQDILIARKLKNLFEGTNLYDDHSQKIKSNTLL